MEQQSQLNTKAYILHIDDHFGLSKALDSELKLHGNFEFYNAHDENEAILILQEHKNISLVILDLDLKGKNGLDLIPSLKNENQNLKILVYSAYTEPIYIENSKKCDVQGYVSKDLEIDELLKAIKLILNGELYFPNTVQEENEEAFFFQIYKELTPKEKEIFSLIIQLNDLKEISKVLGKSEKTINNQKSSLFEKFYVKNTMGLLKCAKILGLL